MYSLHVGRSIPREWRANPFPPVKCNLVEDYMLRNRSRSFLCIAALAALGAASPRAQIADPIRWACIGNSITQGPSVTDAYPAKLGKLLGPGYVVENDGSSGRTLMKNGDVPYWTQGKLSNVFAFKPDIVTIKLGTNDSKPINWDKHKGEFERDLIALIDTVANMPSKPKVWLCIPVPAFSDGSGDYGIRGSVIKNEIIPIIQKVAAAKGLPLIDLYTPMLSHKAFFGDNVHPNAEGHDSIAAIIYRTYLSKSTRVACIGNSITEYAFGTPGTEAKDAYPIKLNELLGPTHYVVNKGKSGAYMQKNSPYPYWSTGSIKSVIDYKANIITIKLGTNDSRQQAWNKDKYIADYKSMIDTLNTINPKPAIWLCLPAPAWKRNGEWPFSGISGDIIKNEVIPAIKQVAQEKGLKTLDLYTPMLTHEDLVADGVHPDARGQDSLAHWIYRALTAPVVSVAPAAAPAYPEIAFRHRNLYVTLPGASSGVARLYGLDGRLAAQAPLRPGLESVLPLAGLPAGRYALAVSSAGTVAVKSLSIGL
jgi:lysophospholipase L1-like esterase